MNLIEDRVSHALADVLQGMIDANRDLDLATMARSRAKDNFEAARRAVHNCPDMQEGLTYFNGHVFESNCDLGVTCTPAVFVTRPSAPEAQTRRSGASTE